MPLAKAAWAELRRFAWAVPALPISPLSIDCRHMKYIFVTGGVVSSLGKGLAAASLGTLLEHRGPKVALQSSIPTSTWIQAR